MTAVKTSKGWQIKLENGKLLPKVYASKEECEKRIAQMKMFKNKGRESDYAPIDGTYRFNIPLEVTEGDSTKGRALVGGTLLSIGKSRNGVNYRQSNIDENDGKTVKLFIEEHGNLEVKNIVGKVNLIKEGTSLKYHGEIRNTATHPDIVEHAVNKEIDVSIDARYKSRKFVEENDAFDVDGLDVRAVCGVGVGGVPANSMDYAIAESFKMYDELTEGEKFEPPESGDAPSEVKDILRKTYTNSRKSGMSQERSAKIAWSAVKKAGWMKNNEGKWVKEVENMSDENVIKESEDLLKKEKENEDLRKQIKEREDKIKEFEEEKQKVAESAKKKLVDDILGLQSKRKGDVMKLKESELIAKSDVELKIIFEYESKIVESDNQESEGRGIVEEEKTKQSHDVDGIVKEKSGDITISESLRKKMYNELREKYF